MKASETRLKVLFDGEKQYAIPLFQRPYSWGRKEWDAWWTDLMEVYDRNSTGRPHFIGAIVTKSLPHTPEGVSRFLVVDGQQRLTTTSLLLLALRDASGVGTLSAKIQELYITNRYAGGDDRHKLVPTQGDRMAYFEIESQNNPIAPGSQIGAAYHYFRDRIEEPTETGGRLDYQKIEQTIMGGLETVSITLEENDDEYRIFESLNATGRKLTQPDLIRNYVFMKIETSQQEGTYQRFWLPLQTDLEGHLEGLFRHVAIGDAGQFIKEDEVYDFWKTRFSTLGSNGVLAELDRLAKLGDHYKRLVNPASEPDEGVRAGLDRLNQWGRLTVYPFLLRVYGKYSEGNIDPEDFARILLTIESFFVRRMFCGVPTNELNRLFSRLFAQLPEDQPVASGVITVLSDPGRRWPTDAAFKEAIQSYPLYTDSRPEQRRLVLERLESALEGKEHAVLEGLSIDHIMPQTLSDDWRSELGNDWPTVYEKQLHVLGNLTLTGYNPDMSNSPFGKKQEYYRGSPLVMNQELAQTTAWDGQAIRKRGADLANLACTVWPGPK